MFNKLKNNFQVIFVTTFWIAFIVALLVYDYKRVKVEEPSREVVVHPTLIAK